MRVKHLGVRTIYYESNRSAATEKLEDRKNTVQYCSFNCVTVGFRLPSKYCPLNEFGHFQYARSPPSHFIYL